MDKRRVFIVDVVDKDSHNQPLVVEINELEIESDLQLSLECLKYKNCLKQAFLAANSKSSVRFNFLDCSCVMSFEEFEILIRTFYPEWTL